MHPKYFRVKNTRMTSYNIGKRWICGRQGLSYILCYLDFSHLAQTSNVYYHSSMEELIDSISRADYDLESDIWSKVSVKAKNLIKELMEVNPEKRLSAKDALKNPWIMYRYSLINSKDS